jgi:hypothetical protein
VNISTAKTKGMTFKGMLPVRTKTSIDVDGDNGGDDDDDDYDDDDDDNNNNNNTIIPIVIGATGIVTRKLNKNLEAVPGKHSIDSLQKTAILGTSHIIRKVLQCEA